MALPTRANRSAIRTAIAEVLSGQLGSRRRMDTGVFYRARFTAFTREQKQSLGQAVADVARNAFEITIGQLPIVDNEATGTANDDRRITNVPVSIHALTAVTDAACVCDIAFGELPDAATIEAQDAAVDQVLSDLEDAVQALYAPGNLAQTSAGKATSIASGMMLAPLGQTGAPTFRVTREDWDLQFIESQIDGLVIVTIAANT